MNKKICLHDDDMMIKCLKLVLMSYIFGMIWSGDTKCTDFIFNGFQCISERTLILHICMLRQSRLEYVMRVSFVLPDAEL